MACYPKKRVQDFFPPITDHLSFSPERSLSPMSITLTRIFVDSSEDVQSADQIAPISITAPAFISAPAGGERNTNSAPGKKLYLQSILDLF